MHVDGTAIGDAIALASARMMERTSRGRVILLVTDGMNNRGSIDPETAARAAAELGIKIYAVGIGKKGEPVPYPTGIPMVTRQVVIDIDDEMLTKVAELTGGKYYQGHVEQRLLEVHEGDRPPRENQRGNPALPRVLRPFSLAPLRGHGMLLRRGAARVGGVQEGALMTRRADMQRAFAGRRGRVMIQFGNYQYLAYIATVSAVTLLAYLLFLLWKRRAVAMLARASGKKPGAGFPRRGGGEACPDGPVHHHVRRDGPPPAVGGDNAGGPQRGVRCAGGPGREPQHAGPRRGDEQALPRQGRGTMDRRVSPRGRGGLILFSGDAFLGAPSLPITGPS